MGNSSGMGDESRKRRFSVSAEPASEEKQSVKFNRKVYPKSDDALERIKQSVDGVFLFQGLEKQEMQLLIDAMFEKKCRAEDEVVVEGDSGDYFYVVESGLYEVWKTLSGQKAQTKVFQYHHKGAFGELALMYNAPRAATVKAVTNGVLWAVDRSTFRHIIVGCTAKKRGKYDQFLQKVPLLKDSSDELRAQIADILETVSYKKGEFVVREGDDAEHFYFVVEGEAMVTLGGGAKEKAQTVRRLGCGDFFGARALMLNGERSANVRAATDRLDIAGMDNASFMRLLSGFYDVFRKNFKNYKFAKVHMDDADLSDME